MARLWHREEWYVPISLNSIPERDFEELLKQNSAAIIPDAWVLSFRRTVYSAEGSARADLAVVDKQYREWFVVEVEMNRHSLHGHVLPQVRVLRDGVYGQDDAEYLVERNPHLDPQRTRDLLRGSPRVFVMADRDDETWRRTLEGADIGFLVMQVYKSKHNDFIFSIDGGVPRRQENVITLCSYNAMLPRQLLVESPGALGIANGDKLTIMWEERATDWVRMDTRESSYLRTRGPVSLRAGLRYALIRSSDGTLYWKGFGKEGLR